MPNGQYPSILAGTQPNATVFTEMIPLNAWKTSSTSITSNTTMAVDPDLQLPVAASAMYAIDMFISYTAALVTSSQANGMLWEMTGPTGATLYLNPIEYIVTGSSGSYTAAVNLAGNTGFGTTRAAAGEGATAVPVIASGTLVTGTASGTLAFNWTQNASNSTPTVVQAGSRISLRRLQ